MSDAKTFDQLRKNQAAATKLATPAVDVYAMQECPLLYRLMAEERDGKQKRKRATVTFYVDGGQLGCCVSDRDGGVNLHLSLDSLESPWPDIEAALCDPTSDWRKSRRR